MPRSNASRSSRASSFHGDLRRNVPTEEISSEMLLEDLMNSKRRAKPKLIYGGLASRLDDNLSVGDNYSDNGSSSSLSTTSLTKDLTKTLKSKLYSRFQNLIQCSGRA